MYQLPEIGLVRILPGAQPGGSVLRDPQEEADQHERQAERHRVPLFADGEADPAPPQRDDEADCHQDPDIGQPVVGEEVGVRRRGQDHRGHPGEAVHAQIEAPERLADVGADRGVHEAGIERHPRDLGPGVLGIGPGADPHLEQFQRQTQSVEGDDHRDLPGRLQPEQVEHDRDHDPVRQQGVVARDGQWNRSAHRQPDEDGDREQAALHLEPAEADQLGGGFPHRLGRSLRLADRQVEHLDPG